MQAPKFAKSRAPSVVSGSRVWLHWLKPSDRNGLYTYLRPIESVRNISENPF